MHELSNTPTAHSLKQKKHKKPTSQPKKESKQKIMFLFNAHSMPARTRDLLLIWPQNGPEWHQWQLSHSRLAST